MTAQRTGFLDGGFNLPRDMPDRSSMHALENDGFDEGAERSRKPKSSPNALAAERESHEQGDYSAI